MNAVTADKLAIRATDDVYDWMRGRGAPDDLDEHEHARDILAKRLAPT
jgi:hypothetical protein